MQKIRTLIVDDSVVYRSQIRQALESIGRIEVVGTASNGKFALERLTQTHADLLILDLEMPEMDGLQTLTELKNKNFKCKVLVFSSASKHGAKITLDALKLGASDFIPKPNPNDTSTANSGLSPDQKIKGLIEPKINALFPDSSPVVATPIKSAASYPKVNWTMHKPKIILIGSSTGGPSALEKIFSELTAPVQCPIVITQHMPPIFTAALANRLSEISGIPASEAVHGGVLEKNHIYVAPGDYHLRLIGTEDKVTMALDQGPLINWVRPAVDPLFSSAAEIFKDKCLAFVLTGMGSDGKIGAEILKQQGSPVVIQSQASCVVFGMPGAVYASGAYDRIGNLTEIASMLREKAASAGSIARQLASGG